jgi:hypothetical protein
MAKLLNYIPKSAKPNKMVKEDLEDLETQLPAQVDRFLERTINIIKGYNLPKKKEQLVIAKVIDALNMDKSQVMTALQKIKKAGVLDKK